MNENKKCDSGKCEYIWQSRVTDPKRCPKCGSWKIKDNKNVNPKKTK